MIKCYLCPLNSVCPVHKRAIKSQALPIELNFELNWLPDGADSECPLYKTIQSR